MDVSLNNTVNNNTKESVDKERDNMEEEDMGIYEDNDKSGSDEESVDNDNSQIQKNKVTDLENNSQTDEVDMERDHVRIKNDSDDNKWINNETKLTSKLEQTPTFTLGEWQLLGPSPVPVPVPVGPSPVPAPVRIGPSLVPAPVGPYPASVPTLSSKDDTKANEYCRSKECSAIYTNSLITTNTSTHPPLNSTRDNKTLIVKNTDNLRFYADKNPQQVPGSIPPYPPRYVYIFIYIYIYIYISFFY
jgi:hypothetical protein